MDFLGVDDDDAPLDVGHVPRLRARAPQDVVEAARRLRRREPVILDLSALSARNAQRSLDMCGGVLYAIDGSLEPIRNYTFVLRPGSVTPRRSDHGTRLLPSQRRAS